MTQAASLPSPLRSPDPPGRGYTCVGIRLLDEWAQNEPRGVTEASQRIADACGVTRPAVAGWRTRARPAPRHWETIETLTGVLAASWESWELLGPAEVEPASEERPLEILDAPLGSTSDELRRSVQRLERLARTPGITPAQAATAEGKRVTALTALARLEERQAIHEHPDAAAFLEDVVRAIEDTLGPDLPPGTLARLGDRLAELQGQRAAAPRKAAA